MSKFRGMTENVRKMKPITISQKPIFRLDSSQNPRPRGGIYNQYTAQNG